MSSPSTGDPVAEARSKEIDRALKEVSLGSHCLHNSTFELVYNITEGNGSFEKKIAEGLGSQELMADCVHFCRMRNVWQKKSSCYC